MAPIRPEKKFGILVMNACMCREMISKMSPRNRKPTLTLMGKPMTSTFICGGAFDGIEKKIAQRLNISKRTVENHMTQALAELRKIAYSTLLLFF